MKKVIAILLCAALFIGACSVVSMAAVGTVGLQYSSTATDGGMTVTGYTGTATDVVIPSQNGSKDVIAIGNEAFADNTTVTSVTVPDTVKTIGEGAFRGATALAEIHISNGLESISYGAFSGCTALQTVYFCGTAEQFQTVMTAGDNEAFLSAQVVYTEEEIETVSLLPTAASEFTATSMGGGTISVVASGSGYKFTTDYGYPMAERQLAAADYITADTSKDIYINYHFRVVTGKTNIGIRFNGSSDTFVSLNYIIDPSYVDSSGNVIDLPVGTYKGSAHISEFIEALGLSTTTLDVSGFYVFAVGYQGEVIVNELSVGPKAYVNPGEVPEDLIDPVSSTLLPETSTEFLTASGGGGTISIYEMMPGYLFGSDCGWPYAYTARAQSDYEVVDINQPHYLYYDFEVQNGAANIVLYFNGNNTTESKSLNVIIDPSNYQAGFGVLDLPAGQYKGYVHVKDLGCSSALMTNGTFSVSDIQVYAVGEFGWVMVNELAIVRGTTVTTTTAATTTTTTTTTTSRTATTTTTTRGTTMTEPFIGETVAFTVGDVSASVGQVIDVPVSVSANHYLVNGQIVITFDPAKLELQEAFRAEYENGESDSPYIDTNQPTTVLGSLLSEVGVTDGRVNYVFACSGATGKNTAGTLFTLRFKVLEPAADGAFINVDVPEMRSNDGKAYGGMNYLTATFCENGSVTVDGAAPSLEKGDVNLDGSITLADAMQAFYHVNEKTTLEGDNFKAADLDDDGTISLGEAMKIFYFVNEKIDTLV